MIYLREMDVLRLIDCYKRLAHLRELFKDFPVSVQETVCSIVWQDINDLEELLIPEHTRTGLGGFWHRLFCPAWRTCREKQQLTHELGAARRSREKPSP